MRLLFIDLHVISVDRANGFLLLKHGSGQSRWQAASYSTLSSAVQALRYLLFERFFALAIGRLTAEPVLGAEPMENIELYWFGIGIPKPPSGAAPKFGTCASTIKQ